MSFNSFANHATNARRHIATAVPVGCATDNTMVPGCYVWWHEEFFGYTSPQSAIKACNIYRAKHTEPDKKCPGNEAGWDEPDDMGNWWLGKFHYNTCPTGTEIVAGEEGKGCQPIEEDEGEQCPVTGKSINTATGNEYHTETIEIGNGLDITLSYNSHLRVNEYGKLDSNKLSPGWTMSYNMYITPIHTINNQNYVVIHRANGRYITYNKNIDNWISSTNDKNKLEKTTNGWTYTNQQNQIETYGNDGKLQSLKRNNNVLIINNSYTHIINQNGNFIDLSLAGSRYTQVTDDRGRVWAFTYSGNTINANLSSITYPDNTIKTFHYENTSFPHALTGITDRNGIRYVTYDYDAQGRVYHEQLAGGVEELSIVYNTDNTRIITNSRGKVSTYTVGKNNGIWQIKDITGPGCSNCSNANTGFVYDPATNDLLSKTVDGKTTKYSNYDSKGQYGTKIVAFGSPEQRKTTYSYDSRFFKKPVIISETSVYANNNKVTTYTYDNNANILSMTITGFTTTGTTISQSTSYQYNGPYNQISQIDGPRTDVNDITTFEYYLDDISEGDNRGRLKRLTNAAGIITRDNIQYTATGKILSEDKPNGLTTIYTYYAGNDRLETISNTDGTKTITTFMDYLASGEIKQITRNYNTPDASTLTLTYDHARRLTKVTDQLGNYVQYTLDTEGNQLEENTYDPNNILKKTITQVFDDYDQVDTSTQSGVTNNMDYGSDGNLYQQTNGNGIITDYSYDSLNRLTQITQDLSAGTQTTANTITAFEYDNQDRVSKVTDANNHNTTYAYDDLGRLTKLTSPDTGIDAFTYDAAGNVSSKTDANGNLTSFTYDALNRPTSIDYVGTDLDVSFGYDSTIAAYINEYGIAVMISQNGINQLTSFSDSKSTTFLSYDSFGNLVDKTQIVNNITDSSGGSSPSPGTGLGIDTGAGTVNVVSSIRYQYDYINRLQSITYPSGLVATYQYNNLNQVIAITTVINGQTINIINNAQYLPMGPLISMDLGNGLSYSSSYDNGYRLNSYQYGTTLSGVYAYDNNHNITNITRETVLSNSSYGYDKLDRINQESSGPTSYTYDKLGNRTSSTSGSDQTVPYTYDPNSNKLTSVNVLPRSYDANGNTLALNAHRFTYNKANRLQSYSSSANVLKAEYFYNGIGQRIYKKRTPTSTRTLHYMYQYNASGQLLHDSKYKDKDNKLLKKWYRETIWLNNRPVAQVKTFYNNKGNIRSTKIYYILSDHLNTPRKVTDSTGTVLWSWDSNAFGSTLDNKDVDGNGKNLEFNLRFPGQYFDNESKQHYNYFRDYEPGTGRYLESDPIGLGGGWNTFGYASLNTISYVDEDGLHPISPNTGFTPYGFKWHTNCVSGHRHYQGRGGVIKTKSCSNSQDFFEYSSYSATDNCITCEVKCLTTFAFNTTQGTGIEKSLNYAVTRKATQLAKLGVKFILRRVFIPLTIYDGLKTITCFAECS